MDKSTDTDKSIFVTQLPVCTEDGADEASKVHQCLCTLTPGECSSLFLLPFLAVLPEQGTEMLSTQLWQKSSYLISNKILV